MKKRWEHNALTVFLIVIYSILYYFMSRYGILSMSP